VAGFQVVVITGASSGVGRATARAFAQRGASLGLIARGADALEATRREALAAGSPAVAEQVDVSNASALEAAAERIEKSLGQIDVWVNNAMVSVFSPVREMTAEEYRRVTEVTYLGVVHGTLSALKRMVPRNQGVIVQVGSALAYRAIPLQSAYCAAKHAVEGFTESLRCELLHDGSGVRVSLVHLPGLNTPHFGVAKSKLPNKATPVPPIFQPEVAAEAIVWASEHAPRELLVTASTMKAVFGEMLAPGLADQYLANKGYDLQQTDDLEDPNRADNLWEPVPGDRGAHGDFDEGAHERSYQLEAMTRMFEASEASGPALSSAASAVRRVASRISRRLRQTERARAP
jgi:NAD(P)-dependent dehydrogenase (short-subunit alcohol dehydrogenase family)